MLVFILFLLFYFTKSEHSKYYCNNNTINVNPNEVIFFETVGYPNVAAYFNSALFPECSMTFNLETSSTNKKFVIFFTNPYAINYIYHDQTSIFWKNNYNTDIIYNNFQGFALHDEQSLDDECFFETKNSFHFEDESQILYISSTLSNVNVRKRSCDWRFTGPKNYGFKIVIHTLNIASDVTLAVTNSTNFYIINQKSAITNKAYYNADNNLFIHLSHSNGIYLTPVLEFMAYISIVKTSFNISLINCSALQNANYIIWSSMSRNDPYGYPNNALCEYELEIPSNTIIVARDDGPQNQEYEYGVDFLGFYDEDTDSFLPLKSKYGITYETTQLLKPYPNGTAKKMRWKFESDGSVRRLGFQMVFELIYCFCAPSIWIVPCDEESTYFITNSSRSDKYCPNMKCYFTIQLNSSCSSKFIVLNLNFYQEALDTIKLRIISDNTTVFYVDEQFNLDRNLVFTIFLKSNSTNIFEVFTSENPIKVEMLNIALSVSNGTQRMYDVKLTNQKPYFVTDYINTETGGRPYVYYAFNIEIEDIPEFENASIQIYFSEIYLPVLYADETMSNFVQCADKKWHISCDTGFKKLFVIMVPYYRGTFRITPSKLGGECIFHSNVLDNINNYATNYRPVTFSAIAGPSASCKFVYLVNTPFSLFETSNDRSFGVSKVWTTASKNDVSVYTGNKNETLLFKFNKKTSRKWQKIPLYSLSYVFEIPANSSILISVAQNDELYSIQPYEYSSTIQTPYYFSTKAFFNNYYLSCFVNYTVEQNIFVTFTVTFYNLSPFMTFQFFAGNILQDMNEVGKSITVTNTSVKICYANATTEENLYLNNPEVIILYDVKLTNELTTKISTQSNIVTTTPTTTVVTTSTVKDVSKVSQNTDYSVIFVILFIIFVLLLFFGVGKFCGK